MVVTTSRFEIRNTAVFKTQSQKHAKLFFRYNRFPHFWGSRVNLATGTLTVTLTTNVQAADRIGIRNVGSSPGQIGVTGKTVLLGGVAIGTFTGTTSLVVALNANATPAAVQALLRNVTYSTISDAPSPLDRRVKVTLTDGDGGTSNAPSKLIHVIPVNDAPVIAAFGPAVTYIVGGPQVSVAASATVADGDT